MLTDPIVLTSYSVPFPICNKRARNFNTSVITYYKYVMTGILKIFVLVHVSSSNGGAFRKDKCSSSDLQTSNLQFQKYFNIDILYCNFQTAMSHLKRWFSAPGHKCVKMLLKTRTHVENICDLGYWNTRHAESGMVESVGCPARRLRRARNVFICSLTYWQRASFPPCRSNFCILSVRNNIKRLADFYDSCNGKPVIINWIFSYKEHDEIAKSNPKSSGGD